MKKKTFIAWINVNHCFEWGTKDSGTIFIAKTKRAFKSMLPNQKCKKIKIENYKQETQ